ncbi:MAG: hypothetical protein GXC76_10975 [Rhodanobacteraceae bacterium]|jgi:hypothetical protein|nr:hypothetical protein [Rhodanobacteraceae bacterium]
MRNTFRYMVLGLLMAAGVAAAPAAFARSHWNVGINLGFPGVSIGYSDCRHCGYGWGGNYVYGSYAYAPAYYAPAPAYYSYSPAYYGPNYYSYPSYGTVYYSDRPVRRVYHSERRYDDVGRYHDRGGHRDGRDYGHRATYYDRGYRR